MGADECSHAVQLHGLCALCGADVEHADVGVQELLLHDASLGVRVAPAEARRVEAGLRDALLRARRLSLILDLDQTVVHATLARASVDAAVAAGRCRASDVHRLLLPEAPGTPYWVVLRPGVSAFLQALAPKYELHVYTMGTRSYARAVAALCDPSGSFFYDRVLSREDVVGDAGDGSLTRKSLARLFPGDDRAVVVVDDRADVWDFGPNLVPVHPYVCFPHAADMNLVHASAVPGVGIAQRATITAAETGRNALDAPSERSGAALGNAQPDSDSHASNAAPNVDGADLEAEEKLRLCGRGNGQTNGGHTAFTSNGDPHNANIGAIPPDVPDEDAHDAPDTGQDLRTLLAVLEGMHDAFFAQRDAHPDAQPDVKALIRARLRTVLAGVRLAFCGVLPAGIAPQRAHPWRMAELFGAECDARAVPGRTTHLVAARGDSPAAVRAFALGSVRVVRVEWLHACYRRFRAVDPASVDALWPPPSPGTTVEAFSEEDALDADALAEMHAEADALGDASDSGDGRSGASASIDDSEFDAVLGDEDDDSPPKRVCV